MARQEGGSRALRAAGFTMALAFRAIPRALRFRAAVVVARRLEPLIARTHVYHERARLKTDDLREISLELLLMMLTRHQTRYNPILRIDGAEHLPAAGTGATLILGPHTMLSTLFLRHLEDQGHAPFVITADPEMGIPGMAAPARVVCPSPAWLLKVRRHLEEGRTIAGMIDRGEPERRSSTVRTSGGPVFVSDALFRLAVHHRARVVFIATRMDEGSRVVVRLSAPPAGSASVSDLVAAFAGFVEDVRHTATASPDLPETLDANRRNALSRRA